MPNPSNDDSIEFRKCLARIKHLEKMVARYSQVEAWENFKEGDRVLVDNSDSKHDGMIGNFIGHDWSASGYVRLVVGFNDGYKCYYLPSQLAPVFDDLEPMTVEDLRPIMMLATAPPPEVAAIESESYNSYRQKTYPEIFPSQEAQAQIENQAIIDAKLAQIANMPKSARRGILKSGIDAGLLTLALDQAIKRGLIDGIGAMGC